MSPRRTEIAIVGGGLAGSLAAAMLGRAEIDAVLIDPHDPYPPDFRCEKLDGVQLALLARTGLADAVLAAATPDRDAAVARYGHIIERRPGDQHGILYGDLVNVVRGAIPASVARIRGKVTALTTGAAEQRITLGDGGELAARLVVLANGLNVGLRRALGFGQTVIHPCHSISFGFDIRPVAAPRFTFGSLTHYSEDPAARVAYLTLFPIGAGMRANLFVYREARDPWLAQFRAAPQATLFAALPGLRRTLGDFVVAGPVEMRPAELYATTDYRRAGIVLVGDAFGTSCPAAGTGVRKLLVDVERLCNGYLPGWLATPGMGADKIGAFYDDPAKRASDAFSLQKAHKLRAFTLGTGLRDRLWRGIRFTAQSGGRGTLRHALAPLSGPHAEPTLPPAGTHHEVPRG